MKTIYRRLLVLILLQTFLLLSLPQSLKAQDPPPPPNGHGASGNQQPGGSAPLGEGTVLLVVLGGVYAWAKLRKKTSVQVD